MPLDPPICLEVVFTNVEPTADPNVYTATFTTHGQGYNSGNNFYYANDLAIGMWAANNAYGYSFRIKSVTNESPESIDVVLEDVDGFNASIDPSGIGGGPGNNTIGYVYELNECGLPTLNDATNVPNFIWTDAQLARFLYQQQCRGLTGSAGGITGPQGPAGSSTQTGAQGAQGYTGPQGLPGIASATGSTGAPGVGVPTGGAQGQILAKIDGTDYNTTWKDPGNATYNDSWITTNLLNPPPYLVFETVESTSTEIYVPWKYPPQIPTGFSWVPAITNMSMQISIDSNAISPGFAPYMVSTLTNVTSNYLNYHDGTPFVTGMILSKIPGVNEIETRTFPDTSVRQAYVFHDTKLATMISTNNSIVVGWYKNTNPSTNKASTILKLFSVAGQPTIVLNLLLSLNVTTGTFSYTAPQYVDSADPSSKLTIILYTITYSSLASPIRYGPPLADALDTVQNATRLSYSPTSLFPDSPYTFTVTATNSDNAVSPIASITGTTKNLLPIAALSGNLQFPDRYYRNGTIVSLSSGVPKSRLLNSIAPWVTSATINTPIQNIAQRGSSQGTTLMTVSSSLVTGATSISGPSINFSGFPSAGSPQVTTANHITLTPLIKDTHVATGGAHTGFYLESDSTLSINTPAFAPSQSDYILTVQQSGSFTGSATFAYQCDTLITTVPIITSLVLSFNGDLSKSVSGVNVLYNAPSFTVTTTVTNLGNFYYSSPILVYSGAIIGSWNPVSEVDTRNVISGLANGAFSPTVVIRNTNIQSSLLTTSYATNFTITVNANNIFGTSAPVTSAGIPVIIDGPSVTLVYTLLPQTIPFLSSTKVNVIGYHISSAIAGASGVPPFTSSGALYANSPYDQSADISTSQDLQISNGTFTTPTGQPYAYINYRNKFYTPSSVNSTDYTVIPESGYRYTTFTWNITPAPTLVYGRLTFTMIGTSGITIVDGLAYVGPGATNPLQIFYRIEDASSPVPTNLANLSSAWINGNSTTGISSTSGNYYIPTDYNLPPYYGLNNVTGTVSPVFSVKIPSLVIQTGKTVRLYCRIGIPMNTAFSFKYVVATLGT
jgi:hypothetical protein